MVANFRIYLHFERATSHTMNLIPQLIADVNRVLDCQGHGSRAKLAQWLQVRPQRLNDWIKGHKEPSGEHALKLKSWLDGKHSDEDT